MMQDSISRRLVWRNGRNGESLAAGMGTQLSVENYLEGVKAPVSLAHCVMPIGYQSWSSDPIFWQAEFSAEWFPP